MNLRTSALALLALSSCGTLAVSDHQYEHAMFVRWDGRSAELTHNGNVTTDIARNVDAIVRGIKRERRKHVFLFVHGGLNSLSGSLKRTIKLIPRLETDLADPADPTQGAYGIFVNWESSLWRGTGDHYFRIRNGREQRLAAIATSPFVAIADIGRAAARLPITYGVQGSNFLMHNIGQPEPASVPPRSSWRDRVVKHDTYERGFGWNSLYWVRQVVPGVARLVTTPLADTFGSGGYRMLLRRADTLFRAEPDYERHNKPSGGLSLLMERLQQYQESEEQELSITLCGHSLGAVAINELIRRFPKLRFDNIIYMGAACSIKDWLDSVVPYMEHGNKDTKFYNLTLHPKADEDESTWFSALPDGSLLEWLDDFILEIKTPLDQTLGKWNNFVQCLHLLDGLSEDCRTRIHAKAFPVRKSTGTGGHYPMHHGDFDNFPFWRKEFRDPQHTGGFKRIK